MDSYTTLRRTLSIRGHRMWLTDLDANSRALYSVIARNNATQIGRIWPHLQTRAIRKIGAEGHFEFCGGRRCPFLNFRQHGSAGPFDQCYAISITVKCVGVGRTLDYVDVVARDRREFGPPRIINLKIDRQIAVIASDQREERRLLKLDEHGTVDVVIAPQPNIELALL